MKDDVPKRFGSFGTGESEETEGPERGGSRSESLVRDRLARGVRPFRGGEEPFALLQPGNDGAQFAYGFQKQGLVPVKLSVFGAQFPAFRIQFPLLALQFFQPRFQQFCWRAGGSACGFRPDRFPAHGTRSEEKPFHGYFKTGTYFLYKLETGLISVSFVIAKRDLRNSQQRRERGLRLPPSEMFEPFAECFHKR